MMDDSVRKIQRGYYLKWVFRITPVVLITTSGWTQFWGSFAHVAFLVGFLAVVVWFSMEVSPNFDKYESTYLEH